MKDNREQNGGQNEPAGEISQPEEVEKDLARTAHSDQKGGEYAPNNGQNDGQYAQNNGQNGEADANKKRGGFRLWQRPEPNANKHRYSRSFQVALAGVSCAIAVAALIMGYYVNVLIGTAYIIAQVALMIPLSKQFYGIDVLAYLATVLLAALVGGLVGAWWLFIPFIMFFGLHPLANSFQLRYRVNRWLALVVKMIWFDAMLFVMYYALGGFLGFTESTFWQAIDPYVWIIILVAGSLFLWLYDYVMFKVQIWINMLVYRIKK